MKVLLLFGAVFWLVCAYGAANGAQVSPATVVTACLAAAWLCVDMAFAD